MFERFTDRARKVMALANQEAQRFNHEYIGTEHILLGIIKEGSGVGANVLKNLGVDLRRVRVEVEKLIKKGPEIVTTGKLPQTPRAKRAIEFAIAEARDLGHNYVGTEHMLLGLIHETDGVAAQVLMNLGVTLASIRKGVLDLSGASGADRASAAGAPLVPERVSQSITDQTEPPEVLFWLLRSFLDELGKHKDRCVTIAEYEKAAETRDVVEEARALMERVQKLFKP